MKSFDSFDLLPELKQFLKEQKIQSPTEVQGKAILPMIEGKSLSVLAQTGSGKTLAYALPLFHRIKINDDDIPMESQFGSPRGIVLTPTRELNHQVFKVLKSLAHVVKLRVRTLVGGDKGKRTKRLTEDAFDILVTSPGKLLTALEKKEIHPDLLEVLIFDEADQLLDMGFSREIKKIHELITRKQNGPIDQVCLFSATWPAQYTNFLKEVFPDRTFDEVICQGGVQLKRNIETFNIPLLAKEKPLLVQEFLKVQGKGTGVIFINKKEDVLKVAEHVKAQFPKRRVQHLHGDLTQNERKAAFSQFVEKGGILIATDIAARGLDIEDLKWVLNYDLPFEAVYYVHRCGRTGRAGKLGKVFNFVTPGDSKLMGRINEAILSQSSLALKTLEPPKKGNPQKPSQGKAKAKSQKRDFKKKSAEGRRTPRYKKKKR